MEEEIGRVTHFFSKISVAVVARKKELRIGRGAMATARVKFSRLNCPQYMTGPLVFVIEETMTTTKGKRATKTSPVQKSQIRAAGRGRSRFTSRGFREVMA